MSNASCTMSPPARRPSGKRPSHVVSSYAADVFVRPVRSPFSSTSSPGWSGCNRFSTVWSRSLVETLEQAGYADWSSRPPGGTRFDRPDDRALVTWKRSVSPATDAICVVILVFPTDRLTLGHPGGTRSKPLLILEPAPAGMAVEVGFFYSCEPLETLEAKFLTIGIPIFGWDLPDGESVSMVARHAPYLRPVPAPTGRAGHRA
jgi:hypothetical protein